MQKALSYRSFHDSYTLSAKAVIFGIKQKFLLYSMPVSKFDRYATHVGQRGPSDPPPQCSDGKVFKSCGTACPRTCDNLGEFLICTRNCVIGCFCPSGTVENGDNGCVQPSDCPGLTTVSPTTSTSHDHHNYTNPEN